MGCMGQPPSDLSVSLPWHVCACFVCACTQVAVRNLEKCRDSQKFVLGTPLTTACHAADAMTAVAATTGLSVSSQCRIVSACCELVRWLQPLVSNLTACDGFGRVTATQ